nr:hypothetical protein [Porphyromonas gulae]
MAREYFRSGARFFQLPHQNKTFLRPRFTAPNTPNFSNQNGNDRAKHQK